LSRNKSLGLEESLLCTEFNTRRVSWHKLKKLGSSYKVKSSVLIESNKSEFHPTDIIEDADGSVLLADTGNWYKICCPTSKSVRPDATGGIYRLSPEEAAKLKDPRGLKLNWDQPEIGYLSDSRQAVVKRAIDVLAKKENIKALRKSKAKVPALWSLNRIPGEEARKVVRSFLEYSDPHVQSAAIHSVGLWRDGSAVNQLINILLESKSLHIQRKTATALGRIGDRRAIGPLLDVGIESCDEFLRHSIAYAVYEIGDFKNLPVGFEITKDVQLMRKNARAQVSKMPEIKSPKNIDVKPEVAEKQKARLKELAALLPKGNPQRGASLFKNVAKSMCLSCHTMGDEGVDYAPDLTKIGEIRNEEDLLEAIVYPNATIARYYEQLIVKTSNGTSAGIFRKHTKNQIVLAPGPGHETKILHKEVLQAEYSPISLMPTVFDGLLSPMEIADIIAYLKNSEKDKK